MDLSHILMTELLTTSGVKDNGFCVSSPGRTETLCSHPLGLCSLRVLWWKSRLVVYIHSVTDCEVSRSVISG